MLVPILVSCFVHYYMETRSKFIVPSSLQSKKFKCMASAEKIASPSSDPDHVVQIPLSDHV